MPESAFREAGNGPPSPRSRKAASGQLPEDETPLLPKALPVPAQPVPARQAIRPSLDDAQRSLPQPEQAQAPPFATQLSAPEAAAAGHADADAEPASTAGGAALASTAAPAAPAQAAAAQRHPKEDAGGASTPRQLDSPYQTPPSSPAALPDTPRPSGGPAEPKQVPASPGGARPGRRIRRHLSAATASPAEPKGITEDLQVHELVHLEVYKHDAERHY